MHAPSRRESLDVAERMNNRFRVSISRADANDTAVGATIGGNTSRIRCHVRVLAIARRRVCAIAAQPLQRRSRHLRSQRTSRTRLERHIGDQLQG